MYSRTIRAEFASWETGRWPVWGWPWDQVLTFQHGKFSGIIHTLTMNLPRWDRTCAHNCKKLPKAALNQLNQFGYLRRNTSICNPSHSNWGTCSCSDTNQLVLLAYWFLNAINTPKNNSNKLPLQNLQDPNILYTGSVRCQWFFK